MVVDTSSEPNADQSSVAIDNNHVASTTTTSEEESVEKKTERAQKLLADGKRALLAGTYIEASETLADACSLFTELFDQFAVECYEPHMLYGKTLLELSRLEPGVFTNALQGVTVDESDDDEEGGEEEEGEKPLEDTTTNPPPTTESKCDDEEQFGNADQLTEEEREVIHEQVEDAFEANAEALDNGGIPTTTTDDDPEDPKPEIEEPTEEDDGNESNKEADDNEQPTEGGGVDNTTTPPIEIDKDDTDNVAHLQLAWEVLEVARAVCDKQDKSDEWQKKKADVLLLLGDVSIEDENYKQAIDDLNLCLGIQQNLYTADDRRIAETLFQIGRAYSLTYDFQSAANYYEQAYAVVNGRMVLLTEKLTTVSDDAKTEIEDEIKELQSLLPDIQDKIKDANESAKAAAAKAIAELSEPAKHDATVKSTTNAVDISSLVRKPIKRNTEVADGDGDDEAKRTKTDMTEVDEAIETNGTNGGDATDVTNNM